MGAPKGNEFYKLVKQPTGRQKKYTPRSLWKKAQAYFEWVNSNPLYEVKAFANGKTATIPKMRAMAESAFCGFAGINRDTWYNYKSGENEYEEFSDICAAICNIIFEHKFTGAAADLLNPSIIARDLGLREKTEVTGAGGNPLFTRIQLTKERINELSEALEDEV